MLAKDVISAIEAIAPRYLADSWDNSGLQIGSRKRDVRKILVAMDLDMDTVNLAIAGGYNMVFTHHPFFFKPIKTIETDGIRGEIIEKLIKNDIVVYSAHTSLDTSFTGMNSILSDKLSLRDTEPIVVTYSEKLYKIGVYAPKEDSDKIRTSMAEAGAGNLGEYDSCSFSISGVGRFRPNERANPHIGKSGEIESVEEEKIEVIATEKNKDNIIKAMVKAHPYEEVAYDLYELENRGDRTGYGVIGNIDKKNLRGLAEDVKTKLNCDYLRVYGDLDRDISSLAICGGSGASFIDNLGARADLYITGDIKYHDVQRARELGIALIDAGHFGTEKHVLPFIKDYLSRALGDVEVDLFVADLSSHTII